MMSLAQASGYFDLTPVLDPDTGVELFKGQVDPYDDSKRDAGSAYRRVLSVVPGTVLPLNRAVRVQGKVWLAGTMEQDGLAEAHREKYVLQPAEKFGVANLANYLTGAAGAPYWAGVEWLKYIKEAETSSEMSAQFSGFFSRGAAIFVNDLVWSVGEVYLVRAKGILASGFLGAALSRVDNVRESVTISGRTYNPVTGAFADIAPTVVQGLRLRWQEFFEYEAQIAARYRQGDDTLVVPASAGVTTASLVTVSGRKWTVLAVDEVNGVLALHLRPA